MDEIQDCLAKAGLTMEEGYARVGREFSKIRAGRALPNMLDNISVVYYDKVTPLSQVASISTPDARTLTIKPWEKRLIPEIEKALLNSRLALTPQNDGETIRLNIPPLTEERRKELVKQVRVEAEKGRVMMRNVRKEVKEILKQLQKAGTSEDVVKQTEDKAQKLTDDFIKKIEELLTHKEAEVMEV
jgi:ribosome recycling factor